MADQGGVKRRKAALIIPAAFCYFGREWAGLLSVIPLTSGVDLLTGSAPPSAGIFSAALTLAAAVLLTVLARNKWVKTTE